MDNLIVGILAGRQGSDANVVAKEVLNMISQSGRYVEFLVKCTHSLSRNFFNDIDVFVFASDLDEFEIHPTDSEVSEIYRFVNNGGKIYCGLDAPQTGEKIANSFGFRGVKRATGKYDSPFVNGTNDPIVKGLIDASTFKFSMSFYGAFERTDGKPFAKHEVVAESDRGISLLHLTVGKGEGYFFSDEVPLFANNKNPELLANALYEWGANSI